LLVLPHDEFESEDDTRFERLMTPPVLSCLGCHDYPGIYSFRSYTGGDYPRGQYYLPDLQENNNPDAEGNLSAMRKREQYSWGLLQGLWENLQRK
jgi:hypothetical protein